MNVEELIEFISMHRRDSIMNALQNNMKSVIDLILPHVQTSSQRIFMLSECFNCHNQGFSNQTICDVIRSCAHNVDEINSAHRLMEDEYLRSEPNLWPYMKHAYTMPQYVKRVETSTSMSDTRITVTSQPTMVQVLPSENRSQSSTVEDPSIVSWEILDVAHTLNFRGVDITDEYVGPIILEAMRIINPDLDESQDMHPLLRIVMLTVHGYCTAYHDIIDIERVMNQLVKCGCERFNILVNSVYKNLVSDHFRSFNSSSDMDMVMHCHPSRFDEYDIMDIVKAYMITHRYDMAIYIADNAQSREILIVVNKIVTECDITVRKWQYQLRNPISGPLQNIRASIIKKCCDPSHAHMWTLRSHVETFYNPEVIITTLPTTIAARSTLFHKCPMVSANLVPKLTEKELSRVRAIDIDLYNSHMIDTRFAHKIIEDSNIVLAARNSDIEQLRTMNITDVATVSPTDYVMNYIVRMSKIHLPKLIYRISHYKFQSYSALTSWISYSIVKDKIDLSILNCSDIEQARCEPQHDPILIMSMTRYASINDVVKILGNCDVDILILKSMCDAMRLK